MKVKEKCNYLIDFISTIIYLFIYFYFFGGGGGLGSLQHAPK